MEVKIGEYRMSDFGLRLLSVELGAAAVDANSLEIPGMNGAIDLTEAVAGYPFYKNAKHKLTFDFMDGSHDTWVWKASSLKGKIHGRRFPVVLGRDSFYYDARISVDTAKLNQAYSQLVVELDASPYKLALRSSVEDWEWDSFNFETDVIREYKNITVPARLDVIGGVMPAGCVFECSTAQVWLTYGSMFCLLPEGRSTVPDIIIREGVNTLRFTGTGSVSVEYREGRF